MNIYRFSTFQELMDRVPADRIYDCLEEIGAMLAAAKQKAIEVAKETGHPVSDIQLTLPDEFEWIDDGKRSLNGKLVDDFEKPKSEIGFKA